MGQPLTPADRERIERLWEDGEAMIDIATAVGRRLSTVHYHLVRTGLHTPLRRVDGRLQEKVLTLRNRGFQARTIQEYLGISKNAYYSTLRRAGIKAQARRIDEALAEAFIQQYESGANVAEMAARHGWSTGAVYAAMRRHTR